MLAESTKQDEKKVLSTIGKRIVARRNMPLMERKRKPGKDAGEVR